MHFQWQLLDWPQPPGLAKRIGLKLVEGQWEGGSERIDDPEPLVFIPAPERGRSRQGVPTEKFRSKKTPDYAARDARNKELGHLGEELVLNFERTKLEKAGRGDLAKLVTHVAVVEGDSAGYDIGSFNVDGSLLHIEVKTTEGGAHTAFFITANEAAFSAANQSTYVLYRLFKYGRNSKQSKAYILSGDISRQTKLTPTMYRAEPGFEAFEGDIL